MRKPLRWVLAALGAAATTGLALLWSMRMDQGRADRSFDQCLGRGGVWDDAASRCELGQ